MRLFVDKTKAEDLTDTKSQITKPVRLCPLRGIIM